jgi:hypothetical protein
MVRKTLLLVGAVMLVAGAAFGDWDPTMPAKWVQMPDESPAGIDINASYDFILADDFECRETGPITDIHIWGSWLDDGLPPGGPEDVVFTLSLHEDIPVGPNGYSQPGDIIRVWEFQPFDYTARVWLDGVNEGWMDPPDAYFPNADFTIWQYNFHIPEAEQFVQQGTPDNPVVYWLDVKAMPADGASLFGWKTSIDHWNDDAVWGDGFEPYFGPWFELIYPPNHEYAGISIDLAFVIVGEEQQVYKWLQPPDLNDEGIDVDATELYILADDYLCTEPGRVTEIWVWGSWLDDFLPYGLPERVDFVLSFHEDIPATINPDGYSIPGQVLWHRAFAAGDFTVEMYADNLMEGWMEPPDNYIWPGDTVCWLYKFYVPPEDAFFQSGTADQPIVYWLDVQAYPHDVNARFGWKTSVEHWNDDAVWGQGSEPYLGPWFELRYPPMHPYAGHSIDLAFRLTNDAESGVRDESVDRRFGLLPNEPNPFTGTTTLRYSLAVSGNARLEVFNVMGQVVSTIVDADHAAGPHTATWSGLDDRGRELPAGIYFCRLTVGNQSATQKMMYLK